MESMGYLVQIAPNPTRWSKQNDLFSCWDLIGLKKDKILFVQVKSAKIYKKELQKYKDFKCPCEHCSKELWILRDRIKAPEIIIL